LLHVANFSHDSQPGQSRFNRTAVQAFANGVLAGSDPITPNPEVRSKTRLLPVGPRLAHNSEYTDVTWHYQDK
jgi:hypothetical protein